MLRVPRRGIEGEEDAGVLSVTLALPPGLASTATHEREIGHWVAVVGMLEVDADYSDDDPRFQHTVVARSIERATVAASAASSERAESSR